MSALLVEPTDSHSQDPSVTHPLPAVAQFPSAPDGESRPILNAVRAGKTPPGQANVVAFPSAPSLVLADPTLALAADILDDLERTRIANQNRLRQFTRDETDADGEERGFGLDLTHPDVARLAGIVDGLARLEHDATLNLQRAMRRHPLGPWVKSQVGIGEKQAARLLAALGDPYWNTLHDRPRTVSELWAYCGLHVLPGGHPPNGDHPLLAAGEQTPALSQYLRGTHYGPAEVGSDFPISQSLNGTQGATADREQACDPGRSPTDAHCTDVGVAAKRRKGQRANWSTNAKTRAHLIAASCIKQRHSPYRAVYDTRRAHTATTHPEWTDGHSHNDALRITSKAVLKELWREARRLHAPDNTAPDPGGPPRPGEGD